MPNLPPEHTPARQTALQLFRDGRITIAEAARLAGVSRQAARMWAIEAGIDPTRARARYLRRLWHAEMPWRSVKQAKAS